MESINIGSSLSVDVLESGTTARQVVEQRLLRGSEESFYVADLGTVVQKHREWKALLPRVQPFYAVKCNDDPVLVRLLAGLGLGFDCASKIEIKTVLGLGVSPSRIVYANPCKFRAHLQFAAQEKVSLMTFDNKPELDKIKKVFPSAKLLLRIRADDPDAICQLGVKFGADPADAFDLLAHAKSIELNVVGVSFHVGSGCQNASAFSMAVTAAKHVFTTGEELGFNFDTLDIGGGFPGTDSATISFQEIAAELNTALDMHFPPSSDITIIAEPGRYYASACYTLAVTVSSKREVERSNKKSFMYYVSDGVYGSFNCLLFDHAVVYPKIANKDFGNELHSSSLWGPTCDSMDVILKETLLPELEIDDCLFFEEMGAYTKASASTFNGYNKPEAYYYVLDEHRATIKAILDPFLSRGIRSVIYL